MTFKFQFVVYMFTLIQFNFLFTMVNDFDPLSQYQNVNCRTYCNLSPYVL